MLISLNCRGLNIPEKRTSLLRELKKNNSHLVFLLETHFRMSKIPNLANTFFPKAYHAPSPTSKSKGVSILVSREASFVIQQQLSDPKARYLFIKGTLAGRPTTLANVYFPNSSQMSYCKQIVDELKWFSSGCIILGGDFNVPLDPSVDTSTGHSSIKYKLLKRLKELLRSLTLVDVWRTMHPEDRDFT